MTSILTPVETLQAFAKDPQWRLEGRIGFISVLHTWSQTLIDHFHLHCLIPAGALSFTKDKWISNNRIISIDNGRVTFTYKDRQKENEIKTMTLDADEFIRRFLLHVLPKGLIKIRYFGFLAHTNKKKDIPLIRKLIDPEATLPEKSNESISEMMLRLTGIDISCCPKCKKGKMIRIRKLPIQDDLNSS